MDKDTKEFIKIFVEARGGKEEITEEELIVLSEMSTKATAENLVKKHGLRDAYDMAKKSKNKPVMKMLGDRMMRTVSRTSGIMKGAKRIKENQEFVRKYVGIRGKDHLNENEKKALLVLLEAWSPSLKGKEQKDLYDRFLKAAKGNAKTAAAKVEKYILTLDKKLELALEKNNKHSNKPSSQIIRIEKELMTAFAVGDYFGDELAGLVK